MAFMMKKDVCDLRSYEDGVSGFALFMVLQWRNGGGIQERSILACRMIPWANLWQNTRWYLFGVFGDEKHYTAHWRFLQDEYLVTRPRDSNIIQFRVVLCSEIGVSCQLLE